MVKKLILFSLILLVFIFNLNYFDMEINFVDFQENSLIGLTINGSSTTTFLSKTSGYAIVIKGQGIIRIGD